MQNLFAGSKARILLAEDNITNQQVALGVLRKMGLRADAVANGAEAIKALETLPYDLALMDVQMPVMDGLEATREIRKSGSRIPIIAMTAHAMRGDRERCLESGMDDYVAKPVRPLALAEALEKWLPNTRKETSKKTAEGAAAAPLHTAPSTTVFDRAGMLDRLMGDEELAGAIARGFLDDIPRQIAALRICLEAGDASGAERQAHSIKGAAANVGGEDLRAAAFEIEKAGKAGILDDATAMANNLEKQFDALKNEMERSI